MDANNLIFALTTLHLVLGMNKVMQSYKSEAFEAARKNHFNRE